MVEKRRDGIFRQIYDELIANTTSEFNNQLWEKVHFSNSIQDDTGKNFFQIYEEYLEG